MLDIDPLLMLLVFVVFTISVYLLNEWLYKPLLHHMDSRDEAIKNDLESISGNDLEISVLKAQAQGILAEAKREAGAIKEEAYETARKSVDEWLESKRAELERQKDEYLSGLEEEKKLLHGALLAQMSLFKESLKIKLSQL